MQRSDRGTIHAGSAAGVLGMPMNRRRVVAGALGISAAAGSRPAIAAAARRDPSSFTLVTLRAPSDLDPHSAYDPGSWTALGGTFERLIRPRTGTNGAYEPGLAASWSANADRSVWTFRLREGVSFHDGSPFDAEAARASFARVLALGLGPSQVLGRFVPDPAVITAPDRRTLVFDLGRPQPLFEAAIASPYGASVVNAALLRRHEIDGDWGAAWAGDHFDGLGTGPYRIVTFDPVDGVQLERFADYWGGWPDGSFDRVSVRVVTEPETRRSLIERGDADLAMILPLATIPDLERNPDLVVDHRFTLAVQYIAMAVDGPLAPVAARQALCWAFPYEEVIAGVYRGFAKRAVGPVAERCRGFAPGTFVYETNLERARALLREAGVAEGTVLALMLPAGNPESLAISEAFGANLAAIGLRLDIQLVEFATYVDVVFGDLPAEQRPHLFPLTWQPDYDDGWNHLFPQLSCDAWSFGNAGRYCNPRVDALLATARDATDAAAYDAALAEVQQIAARDDPAAIYVAQAERLTVLRRDIAGFVPDPVIGSVVDFHALRRATG